MAKSPLRGDVTGGNWTRNPVGRVDGATQAVCRCVLGVPKAPNMSRSNNTPNYNNYNIPKKIEK